MKTTVYNITPVPKPRQTRADKWKKRPCVIRYRAFADEVRDAGIEIPESGFHVIFVLPMPESWSNKKKTEYLHEPHRQKPDIDNLLKALLDAVHKEDCYIWDGRESKIWGYVGKIVIVESDFDFESHVKNLLKHIEAGKNFYG